MPKESNTDQPFGLWSATFLVVANMIGAGIFTTSGYSLADLGSRQFVVLAWAIGALIAICGAISYGQLAQRVTESGGEYLFLSRFVHPAIGFIAGWVSLLAGFTGAIAFAAWAFEAYAIPDSMRPDWLHKGSVGVATILAFAGLHAHVMKLGVVTQNLVVVLKLFLLAGFTCVAFSNFPGGWEGIQIEIASEEFSVFALASTLVWISLSFSGFNAAVYVTSEVVRPKQNVPRALLYGTVAVSVLYLLLNIVFLYGSAPSDVVGKDDVARIAAQAIGGDSLAILIRIIVCVALLSSVSSMVIAGPRVYAKMAEDGLFPRILAKQDGRRNLNVPSAAIWFQASLASVVVYSTSLKSLLDHLGFTLSVSAAITVACIFWTRRDAERGIKTVFFVVVAVAYVVATLGLATLSAINRPWQFAGFAIAVTSGWLLYYVFNQKPINSKNKRSN